MNHRYVPDADGVLKTIVQKRPAASLHELHRSHPILRSMSLDHLSLLLERMARQRSLA
ncbi:hypothetical protein [Phenylobacterium montanum]|uniref:Uncharacterized protein n=1 Tax=Phenylobacterium montanum TaxID=2823693 RepID=A0A975IWJ3_9CAUL|nr:hypothetical protein [Caulobacter sp. S6]QUD89895.1 hypothetical protein KCG34_08535 [Caulobacter sp. S6]